MSRTVLKYAEMNLLPLIDVKNRCEVCKVAFCLAGLPEGCVIILL